MSRTFKMPLKVYDRFLDICYEKSVEMGIVIGETPSQEDLLVFDRHFGEMVEEAFIRAGLDLEAYRSGDEQA